MARLTDKELANDIAVSAPDYVTRELLLRALDAEAPGESRAWSQLAIAYNIGQGRVPAPAWASGAHPAPDWAQ